MRLAGFVAAGLFVGTVFAANWAVEHVGVVPVGFGLMAPAGVYFAGLAFFLRDLVHRTIGKRWALAAIAVGAAASWWVSPVLAVASASAFAVSELVDFAVYLAVVRRGYAKAVGASGAVASVVDSAVFLWLAFGSLEFLYGQVLAKWYMTLAAVALVLASRRALAHRIQLQ